MPNLHGGQVGDCKRCLLADAERGEDRAEQIVAAEFAGDFAECVLRGAQFFCGEFAGALRVRVLGRVFQMFGHVAQCGDVPRARAERAGSGVGCAAEPAQFVAQQWQSRRR